jgi:hypothetical protein
MSWSIDLPPVIVPHQKHLKQYIPDRAQRQGQPSVSSHASSGALILFCGSGHHLLTVCQWTSRIHLAPLSESGVCVKRRRGRGEEKRE